VRGSPCACERRGAVSREQKKEKRMNDKPEKKKKRKGLSSMGCGMAHPRTRCEATSCCVTSQNQAEKGVSPRARRGQGAHPRARACPRARRGKGMSQCLRPRQEGGCVPRVNSKREGMLLCHRGQVRTTEGGGARREVGKST
jgi:hypothetical protein